MTIRWVLVTVAGAVALSACTADNPDYQAFVAGCDPIGARLCAGQRPVECVAATDGGVLKNAACHPSGTCAAGRCTPPTSPVACVRDTDCAGRVCALFVQTGGTSLGSFCAEPDGALQSGAPCTADAQCRSSLCLRAGGEARGRCYGACQDNGDCGRGTVCGAFDATITGTRGTVRSCTP